MDVVHFYEGGGVLAKAYRQECEATRKKNLSKTRTLIKFFLALLFVFCKQTNSITKVLVLISFLVANQLVKRP